MLAVDITNVILPLFPLKDCKSFPEFGQITYPKITKIYESDRKISDGFLRILTVRLTYGYSVANYFILIFQSSTD